MCIRDAWADGDLNAQFSVPIFWQWIINALIHSFVCPCHLSLPASKLTLSHLQVIYVCTATIFKEGLILVQGWVGGQWVWGTTLYLTALVTVLGKAALISECAAPASSPFAGLS